MHTMIQLQEIEMNYEDHGSGETVVLLHGFCGSSAYWKNVIPVLSKHYRVIAPDLRGHGRSEAPLDTYTMERMADDIKQLLDELKVSEAVLFGHSLGGSFPRPSQLRDRISLLFNLRMPVI